MTKDIHQLIIEGQLRKIPIVQEAIRETAKEENNPDLPIEVIVESINSSIPLSRYECIGYEFIQEDNECRIYRRIIKALNTIANEDTGWTIEDCFHAYNMGAYHCNAHMVHFPESINKK